jgi:hypothetical protein
MGCSNGGTKLFKVTGVGAVTPSNDEYQITLVSHVQSFCLAAAAVMANGIDDVKFGITKDIRFDQQGGKGYKTGWYLCCLGQYSKLAWQMGGIDKAINIQGRNAFSFCPAQYSPDFNMIAITKHYYIETRLV